MRIEKMKLFFIMTLQVLSIAGQVNHFSGTPLDEISANRMIDENTFTEDDINLKLDDFFECIQPCHKSNNVLYCSSLINGTQIPCLSSPNGIIAVGDKSPVRRIASDSLDSVVGELQSMAEKPLVTVNFRMNIMELHANNFEQLSKYSINLRIFNFLKLHPDAIIDLRLLNSFEVHTRHIPELSLEKEYAKEHQINLNNVDVVKSLPAFLRLKPLDASEAIIFNIPVCCHSCEDGLVVVAFGCTDSADELKGRMSTDLFIIYPSSCLKRKNALGCRPPVVQKNSTIEPFYMPRVNVRTLMDQKSGSVLGFERETSQEYGRIHFTLILLSIWCTLITLTLIVFICILCRYCRTKNMAQNKFFNLFYPNLLHHPSDRLEVDNFHQSLSITPATGAGESPPITNNNSNNSTKSLLSSNGHQDYNQIAALEQNVEEPFLVPKERSAYNIFNSFFFPNSTTSTQPVYHEKVNKASYMPPKVICERRSKRNEDLVNNNSVYVNHDMLKSNNQNKYNTIRLSSENIHGINCIEIP